MVGMITCYFPDNFEMLEEWAKGNGFEYYERKSAYIDNEIILVKDHKFISLTCKFVQNTPFAYVVWEIEIEYKNLR